VAFSPVRFPVDPELVAELRAWRGGQRDHIEATHDAYCVDGGLGPTWYLTSDGRVLRDGTCWDDAPLREATPTEAYRALVVGARKSKIPRLLDLLPARPSDALVCDHCDGDRVAAASTHFPGESTPRFVCPACDGLGWQEEA
jgi:hypothetical protein